MKFYEKAKEIEEYIIDLRRCFHENPELSGAEFETIKTITKELDKLDVEYIEIPDGGILGRIKGNRPGNKKVLLRADIDALPVDERDENLKNKRVCKSKNEGIMHACGHDGHTAMLLGAIKLLIEEKDNFGGEIILCFERGEEGFGNHRQIHAYMEKYNIVPDSVWAVHLISTQETGTIGIRDGAMMAGSLFFDITLEGKGGHGSRPDQANNPISAFTAIYNNMESIRINKIDPFETISYSIGSVNAGSVANVIPQKLTFKGTVRFLDREKAGYPFYYEFKEKVEKISEAYGVKATFNSYPKPGFPLINDATCAKFARKLMIDEFGEEKIIKPEPWMASESMSSYHLQWPGIFAFLGMKNEEKGIGAAHHNEYFDIDEDVLVMGATGAASYAVNFLNSDLELEGKKYRGKFKEYLKEIGLSESEIEKYYEVEKQEF